MPFTRMDIIDGVLAWWAQSPAVQQSEAPNSKLIDTAINVQLPLFQSTTLDWSYLWTYYTSTTFAIDPNINLNAEGLGNLYSLPSDFGAISEVFFAGNYSIQTPYILCSTYPLQLRYVRKDSNFSIMPAHFVDYFTIFLASKFAMSVTRDLKLKESLNLSLLESKNLAAAYENNLRPVSNINSRDIFIVPPTNVL